MDFLADILSTPAGAGLFVLCFAGLYGWARRKSSPK